MIIGNYIITIQTPVRIKKAPYLKEMRNAIKEGNRLKALVIYKNATRKARWESQIFVNKLLPEKDRFIIRNWSKSNKNMIIGKNYIIIFRTPVHIKKAPYLKEIRAAIKEGIALKAVVIYKNATGKSRRDCKIFVNKFLPEKDKIIIEDQIRKYDSRE